MKNTLKFYLLAFFLISDVMTYAQGDTGDGGLEGNDPPPAPINSKLIILLFLGLVLAFKTLKQRNKKII
ncbi:hypothetical protein [Flavobacterium sp.]|uniref:hypothetical protein n=1 Tax=Flavobacterium sp. TaxID=239 RepID=UPI002FDA29DA